MTAQSEVQVSQKGRSVGIGRREFLETSWAFNYRPGTPCDYTDYQDDSHAGSGSRLDPSGMLFPAASGGLQEARRIRRRQ
jgi:hypothetical protein